MARYFKKRRKNQGPNKNEEKVLRAAQAREGSGGSLGGRYSSVKRVKITLRFLTAQQQLLEEKTLELKASDPYDFGAPCPGRCGTGHFDFSEAVSNTVARRQSVAESGGICKEPVFAGAQETCGCQLKCRMEIEYAPQAETAAAGGPGPTAAA